jgi:hypothetical protein
MKTLLGTWSLGAGWLWFKIVTNIYLYQTLILSVFVRLDSGRTVVVDLFEYCGHTPSVAEVKNEWSRTSTPPVGPHCVYSDKPPYYGHTRSYDWYSKGRILATWDVYILGWHMFVFRLSSLTLSELTKLCRAAQVPVLHDTTLGLRQNVSRIHILLYSTWQDRSVYIRIMNISEHVCWCDAFVLPWMPRIPISQLERPNFDARLVEWVCISGEGLHTVGRRTDFVVTFNKDEANNFIWKPRLACRSCASQYGRYAWLLLQNKTKVCATNIAATLLCDTNLSYLKEPLF